MDDKLTLKNNLKDIRLEKNISQQQLADMVGVSRNTISSIETGQFNPTAKLALILCIATAVMFLKHWENIVRIAKKEEIGLRSTVKGEKRIDKK